MDRSLLSRATENSDAPTPGYMYLDIAKNAATSPQICSEIAKYLANRLASKNNSNVKFKCLKVIAKTATSPYLRGQFKRSMAQDPQAMAAIKDALQYRGPPDPVRGDEPYQKVRTAAKEALDAIYSDTGPEQSSGGAPFSTSISSSYGQSPHAPAAAGAGGRRMEGIGNPMFKDPRLEPQPQGIGNMTVNDFVREAKETVAGMIKDPLARNMDAHVSNHVGSVPRPGGSYGGPSGYGGGGGGGYSGSHPPGRSELMQQTNGEWTMKSNRGPDAVGLPPNYERDSAYFKAQNNGQNAYAWAQQNNNGSSGGVGGSWGTAAVPSPHQAAPSITVNSAPAPPGGYSNTGGGGTAVSDGSYEKQLIMELCPPGGMKPEPPSDKLAQFARTVANLNPDMVCPVLLDCLEDGQPWIIRAKALCVMEVCIQHGQKPGADNNPYADFFHACAGEVVPLASHSRAAVKEPAKRVMALLGLDANSVHASAPPAAAPPASAPPVEPVADLLGFGDEPAPAPAAPPQQPPPPPPVSDSGGNSMFGGLKVNGGAAPAPPPAAAPPVAAPPSSGNLLGEFGSSEAPASGGNSLFGDMQVKSAPAPPPPAPAQSDAASVATASSMFENMSVKSQEQPTPAPPPPPPPPATDGNESLASLTSGGGSAFGFINQSSSNDSGTEKKENNPEPLQVNTKDSFDPLKGMGGNMASPRTAQKMMQLSPQQIQAMAYQQMMMQQQQQQMQMAQMQQLSPQQMQALAYQQMMMQQQQRGSGNFQLPNGHMVMQNPAAAKSAFAFTEAPKKKDDKSFDFVKDAMKKG